MPIHFTYGNHPKRTCSHRGFNPALCHLFPEQAGLSGRLGRVVRRPASAACPEQRHPLILEPSWPGRKSRLLRFLWKQPDPGLAQGSFLSSIALRLPVLWLSDAPGFNGASTKGMASSSKRKPTQRRHSTGSPVAEIALAAMLILGVWIDLAFWGFPAARIPVRCSPTLSCLCCRSSDGGWSARPIETHS